MATKEKPETVTGGCLCENIRYTVTFPPDHDFAKAVLTCQCEQCRKQTGSLIFRTHRVPKSAVLYSSKTTLKLYNASPGCERGICTNCGSFLFWQKEDGLDTSLLVGCFNKSVLQQYGPLLTTADTHLFCEAEIAGVTDHLKGEKWAQDNE